MLRTTLTLLKNHLSSLNQSSAQQRFQMIQKQTLHYHYHLTLHKGNHYDGLANISFQLNKPQN